MAIYFIQAGTDGPIKIGLSDDPPFRLIQLQVSHWQTLRLLAVMDGDAAEEAQLHGRFSAAFIRGEWHWPVPDLLALIEDHRKRADAAKAEAYRRLAADRAKTPINLSSRRHITDIIRLWPSIEMFAEDAGVSVSLVYVWRHRKSIPADRWSRIEAAAKQREIDGVTASVLARAVAADQAAA